MKKVLSLGTVVFVCLSVLLMAIPAVSAETATGAAVTQKIDFGAMTALPATLSDTPFSVAATSAYSLNGDAVKYEMAADAGTSHYLQVLVTSLPSAKVTVTAEITGDGTLKPVLSAVSKDGSAILATQAAEVSNTKKTVVLTYSANAEGVAVVRVNLGASASDEVNAYAGTATLNSLNVSFGVNNLVVLNEGTTAPKKTAGNAPSNSWCTNGTFETVNPKFTFSVEDGVQVVHYNSDADLNGWLFYIIDFGEEAAGKIIKYAKENGTEADDEPYRNSIAGIIAGITEEYLLADDSVLRKDPAEGITYKILLNDLRISRYVDYGVVKVGDTVQISYEGEIDKTNTITTATSASEAIIVGGDMLIPE